ncbi:MAG: DUF1638 domain-containing protein [Planctomycetes bacterium]|nr:DUF1638 domain-containing protein [Planctomycetota bacterium]
MRLGVIACAVLEIELEALSRGLDNIAHVEIMEQGLHNEPDKLRAELQKAVDRVEALDSVDAIVLLYGLCSRGIEGVVAKRCLIAVPRAHDCITLLLGSKERYAKYMDENPGTYWYSPGWNKCHIPPSELRFDTAYKEYVEKYGEDNAEYLMEIEQNWMKEYTRATYVDMGVCDVEDDIRFTRECADWLHWKFDRQHGDPGLFADLIKGNWDEERFLVLKPDEKVKMVADATVMTAVPA